MFTKYCLNTIIKRQIVKRKAQIYAAYLGWGGTLYTNKVKVKGWKKMF